MMIRKEKDDEAMERIGKSQQAFFCLSTISGMVKAYQYSRLDSTLKVLKLVVNEYANLCSQDVHLPPSS